MNGNYPGLIFAVSGEGIADQSALLDELRDAFEADVGPAPVMGAGELWRLAVEWGPQAAVWGSAALGYALAAKPAFEALELALKVVDKLLDLLRRRRGVTLTLPSRDGPIVISDATREQAAELIALQLSRGQPSKEE